MKKYKVLFIDLDGTIINPRDGYTFPRGIWDMEINFKVLDAINNLQPNIIVIVTNQGGIELGFVNKRNFEFKMEYIIRSIQEYTGVFVEYSYCPFNDSKNHYRKPNTGMLDAAINKFAKLKKIPDDLLMEDILMVGDMATDELTANNFGCDYLDVNDFIKNYRNE